MCSAVYSNSFCLQEHVELHFDHELSRDQSGEECVYSLSLIQKYLIDPKRKLNVVTQMNSDSSQLLKIVMTGNVR